MNSTEEKPIMRPIKGSMGTSGLDPLVMLNLLKKNWYLFLIGIAIGLYVAKFYVGHTLPTFRTTATLLINETERRSIVDNTELLQGLGLPGGMQNLENQMILLKSRELIERTLRELPFEVELYIKTMRNRLPVYPETPIKIVIGKTMSLPYNTEFSIKYLTSNSFILVSESDYFPLTISAQFGEDIDTLGGVFRIECLDEEWMVRNKDRNLCFIIHSRNNLINYFSSRLSVEMMTRGGSMLRISMVGTNPAKDADFLNKHMEGFQLISLEKKNMEADRRIQFIDDQIIGISDSLNMTETRLQQFRSSNRVTNLSAQGQSIIEQVTLLENERARLNLEANYYDYLADYLEKESNSEVPIIPITMGISDVGLARLVEELAELQGQLSTAGAGELNPIQRNLTQRMLATKAALKETLNGLRRANSLARSENQDQISRANTRASSLPVTERQLLGFERRFRLNDELYTYLLETRAEQQMQKASNRADSEIIDKADTRFSVRVSPDPIKTRFLGILGGFALPFLIVLLRFLLNRKIGIEDLAKTSVLPVIGTIPHSDLRTNKVVFDDPTSSIAESFRLLRSRMQFLTKEARSPVILVTSSMPDDGKTFLSINLASVYSLLEKKTVIVGFDLRKPKIYNDFGLQNNNGVSTWLIGKDRLQDIIQETSFKNLSVISAGPVPPNPSELTALEKTKELFNLLKEKFEYIIVDSSPMGVVSDTYHLASLADTSILVIRPGKTFRDIFQKTTMEIIGNEIKGISIVMNDTKTGSDKYGYGGRYGYTDTKDKSKFKLFKRKISSQTKI